MAAARIAVRTFLRAATVGLGANCAARGFSMAAAAPSGTSPSRVGVCQFAATEDKVANIATATRMVRQAAAGGARLIVLPEVWNGPYATSAFGEYAERCPSVGEDGTRSASPSVCALAKLAAELQLVIVGGSIAELEGDGKLYNTCLVYDARGEIVAKHRKVHLFDIDVPGKITFKESDTLSPGSQVTTFDAGGAFGRVGVGICYDIRFPELSLLMAKEGARILVYPGAFNMVTGPAHWELLMRARATDAQAYVIGASPARSEPPAAAAAGPTPRYPHYTAWGHSIVVSPWGEVQAHASEGEQLLLLDLEMGRVEEVRANLPTSKQKRADVYTVEPAKGG